MLKNFYSQQIAATIAIVAAWVVLIACLTRTERHDQSPEAQVAQMPREKFEPRDEKTGEESRVHRFNDHGQRTEIEVNFRDKTRGTIYFNALGRPIRAVEIYPDGSSQVFYFDRAGGFQKRQSLRPDGSPKSETVPSIDGATLTRRFDSDGKTVRVSEHVFLDGRFETTVYRSDGRTPEMSYRSNKDGTEAELVSYTEAGHGRNVEKIERTLAGCGQVSCHECGGSMSVQMTRYRQDGTVWFRARWHSEFGSNNLSKLEEFHDDGKTVKTRIEPKHSVIAADRIAGGDTGVTSVEHFDAKGKLIRRVLLRGDASIVSEETVDGDGNPSVRYTPKGDAQKESLEYEEPLSNRLEELLPRLTPQEEPNHLQQMFSR